MTLPLSIQTAWPVAFLAAVPLLFWLGRRSRTQLGPTHLRVAVLLRSLAIVSLALAMMRPQWNGQSGDVSVVYALDISRSVSSSFIDAAIKWIEEADRQAVPARARYVAFADHAVLLQKPADIRNLVVTDDGRVFLGKEQVPAADLSERIAPELQEDPGKKIMLISTNNTTLQQMVSVMDRIYDAGGHNIAISYWKY